MRDWSKLINSERFRPSNKNNKDERSEFERDYDRIIYCSAFRRLQDKAQVYPLEKYDYVRTRLTHSLEVSSLGRSFGTDIAKKLVQLGKVTDDYTIEFSNILSSVSLIHDIGNPPFGHCGEDIIQSWFKKWFYSNSNKTQSLSPNEKLDFMEFEGNAQALRIMTRLQYLKDEFGLNLTYSTLASLIKYPISSGEAFQIVNSDDGTVHTVKNRNAKYKKFGYFQSEKDRFYKINEMTEINHTRHPLAFLMEAADDIAYSAADIEDGHKKGSISYELVFDKFVSELGSDHPLVKSLLSSYSESKSSKFPDHEDLTMQKIRIIIQSCLMRNSIETFLGKYDNILEGSYSTSLISGNDESALIFKILTKDIGVKHIYNDKDVLLQELIGNKVLTGLLDIFVPAALCKNLNDSKSIFSKYYVLISPNFKYIMDTYSDSSTYNKLQLVTDFICGMTDSYAFDLYQKLSGVKLL